MDRLPGLGRQADRRHAVVSVVRIVGRSSVKARVRAAAIVEIEVPPDPVASRTDAVVGVQGRPPRISRFAWNVGQEAQIRSALLGVPELRFPLK